MARMTDLRHEPEEDLGEEERLAQGLDELIAAEELDEDDKRVVEELTVRILLFAEELSGKRLFKYQRGPAARIIESVVSGDGERITVLMARQVGKTEVLATVCAALMVLLPRLAKFFPKLLGKFEEGFWVGCFAPIDQQAETLFSRVVGILTSERATSIIELDPEIDDKVLAGGKLIRLRDCKSFCRQQTAAARAKIESKSYHLVLEDESQDIDDLVASKSIAPMVGFYAGTIVLTGTPATHKGHFYRLIQLNKRRMTQRGSKQNHFEANWRSCAAENRNYAKHIARERLTLGEDSDEYLLSYELRWLLDRGMFISASYTDPMSSEFGGDLSMPRMREFFEDRVVAGIDVARDNDSTVVTVVWIDWNQANPFGLRHHRILNWLEIHGENWESQYAQIAEFLSHYDVIRCAVDSQGMGGPVAERLQVIFGHRIDVVPMNANTVDLAKRWKHLTQLIDGRLLSWPAHAHTRRLAVYRRFIQQMEDAEKGYTSGFLKIEAPDERGAHDDYPNSLSLACALSLQDALPTMEVTSNFLINRRRDYRRRVSR